MEKPQYIDWIVEETGIVIKDDIPLKCYKIDYKDDESILDTEFGTAFLNKGYEPMMMRRGLVLLRR